MSKSKPNKEEKYSQRRATNFLFWKYLHGGQREREREKTLYGLIGTRKNGDKERHKKNILKHNK
jgi:hypothetical protein